MKNFLIRHWPLFFALLLLVTFVIYKLSVLDIVWEVSSSEAEAWQESVLPSNAVQVQQTDSQAELIRQSLFLTIPLIIGFCTFIVIGKKRHRIDPSRSGIVLGAAVSFLLQPLHELLHGIAFPKGSVVHIGMITSSFSGYAVSDSSMNLAQCIFYHLFPAFILGFVPLLLFLVDKQKKGRMCWALYGFSMIGFIQTAPDWFGLFPILMQVPGNALIQMSGWDTYWYIP